jgi:hypothetical protein
LNNRNLEINQRFFETFESLMHHLPHSHFDRPWLWDAHQDVRFAHRDTQLESVIHVFHKEWHGIRAACGSLPGQKVAIPETEMSDIQLDALLREIISRYRSKVVFHGMSVNFERIISGLARRGFKEALYIVFHGSPAQWWNATERKLAFAAIELAQKGIIQRLHIIKSGMELPDIDLFRPMLLNISPKLPATSKVQKEEKYTVFIPGWGNWIKNVFGSALGAASNSKVAKIWVFAKDLELPGSLNNKLQQLMPREREATFTLYQRAQLTLNISLVDCHPMVNVESQTVGTPCLRSNLHLDCHEDHPYIGIVNVNNNNSTQAIKDGIERVQAVPTAEMRDMIFDYQKLIDLISLDRYKEFLEI